jgi:hypothetical protein
MSHIACVQHKRRVALVGVEIDLVSAQWTVLHREDGSECQSPELKTGKKILEDYEILDILTREVDREQRQNAARKVDSDYRV